MPKPRVLVITPIRHIQDLYTELETFSEVIYLPEATSAEVIQEIPACDAVFTNPNKSNVFLGSEVLAAAGRLSVICTASTGTNHIDKKYARERDIAVLCLTEQREVINRISSTAEHAFALTMAALRKIPQGWQSVKAGGWDYEPFIGRQLNHLSVGVIGYGRLGTLYSSYCTAFGARVLVYDPYKKVEDEKTIQVKNSADLLTAADVISIHVHVTDETHAMINRSWFGYMKPDVLIINTARGDVVNEEDLVVFLKKNKRAFYATDVLSAEITAKEQSPVLQYALESDQVLITPHIGGMTVEGQYIAYGHAVKMLKDFLTGS